MGASAIYEDVVQRDTQAHWHTWRNISVQQLNAELAVQLHSLCLKNQARKIALRGLYRSLRNMTVVFSAILLLFAIFSDLLRPLLLHRHQLATS